MNEFRSLKDALVNPEAAEDLFLDVSSLDAKLESLVILKNLKVLNLKNVSSDLKLPDISKLPLTKLVVSAPKTEPCLLPSALLETSARDITLRNIRVAGLIPISNQVDELTLISPFIYDDIRAVPENFKNLKRLEIWGYHGRNTAGNPQAFELPETIDALQNLVELEIVSTGMNQLPKSFQNLESLEVLTLRNLAFEILSQTIAKLPKIKTLEASQMRELKKIPSAFSETKTLRTLNLKGSWNGGPMPMSFEEKTYEALPVVLEEMTFLESLNIDQSGVGSLEFLSNYSGLKSFSAEWGLYKDLAPLGKQTQLQDLNLSKSKVNDISALASLTNLETLDLSSTRVSDITSLANLKKLRRLDLSSTRVSKSDALDPLLDHPQLADLKSDLFEDGEWSKFKSIPKVDRATIDAGLSSDDFSKVEEAIETIIAYVEARAHDDANPLYGLFGMDSEDWYEEGEPADYALLDSALERWRKNFSPALWARLARATFRSAYDGWNATVIAIEELIAAKDIEAQLEFVKGWHHATEYYDGGHRMWEDTVHDQLIDTYWEQFQPEALAALLVDSPDDELDSEYGDGLDALIEPCLSNLKTYIPALMDRVRDYSMRNLDSSYGTEPGEKIKIYVKVITEAIEPIATELKSIMAAMIVGVEALEKEDEPETEKPAAPKVQPLHCGPLLEQSYMAGIGAFVEVLEVVESDGPKDVDVAAAFSANMVMKALQTGNIDGGNSVMMAYEKFVERNGMATGQMRNELAAKVIVLVVMGKDEGVTNFFIRNLASRTYYSHFIGV